MKKSEIRQIIKEELLNEAKRKWPVYDINNTVFKTSVINTDSFDVVQKSNDNKVNLILINYKDIPLFVKALQGMQIRNK